MFQAGGGRRLGMEPLKIGCIRHSAGQDHLDGDEAIELHVAGLEDDAHAAAAQLVQQFVVADLFDDGIAFRREGPIRLGGQVVRIEGRGNGRVGHRQCLDGDGSGYKVLSGA